MVHIRQEVLWNILSAALGSRLADGLMAPVTHLLESYVPACCPLEKLAAQVEDLLFSALYAQHMHVMLDSGASVRIPTDQLSELADDCLLPLLAEMKPDSEHYALLSGFAMQGSRSAQSVIYLMYRDYIPAEERKVLHRVLSSRFQILPDWLKDN